jgi:hypothetical protein
VHEAIDKLDSGDVRAAEVIDGAVIVHEWAKEAVLLYLALSPMVTTEVGPFEFADRVPLKRGLQARGVRALPGAIVHGPLAEHPSRSAIPRPGPGASTSTALTSSPAPWTSPRPTRPGPSRPTSRSPRFRSSKARFRRAGRDASSIWQ